MLPSFAEDEAGALCALGFWRQVGAAQNARLCREGPILDCDY